MTAGRVHIKIGQGSVVAAEGVLFTIGLGSCVAVAIYDADSKVGGLAHVMLPEPTNRDSASPYRFAPTAVPELIERMVEAGAQRAGMYARIAGGAAMFADLLPPKGRHLGDRNVAAVKTALEEAAIPLRGEDVGGSFGRSVFFDASDGSVVIRAVQRADVVL